MPAALLTLLLLAPAHAAALLGVAWAPPGVGALAWSDGEQFSGTLAGEFDGLLRPPLTAHGGWIGKHDAVLGGLALVRFSTGSFGNTDSYEGVGSTRLSVDYRRYLLARNAGNVGFYGTGGGYYILPNAADVSDGYTPEEQDAADEGAGDARARIGGLGGQVGVGAEYLFGDAAGRPAVAVGLRYVVRLYRGQAANDEGYTISTILLPEAALVVEWMR